MKLLALFAIFLIAGFFFFGSTYNNYQPVHYGSVSYPTYWSSGHYATSYYGYYNYYRPSFFGYRSW